MNWRASSCKRWGDKISAPRWSCSAFSSPGGTLFRRLVHVPVAAGDQPHTAPDLLVGLIWQIRQGDAKRPVGGFESTAIQQDDPVGLGQAECEIERVDVLLQVLDGIVADILSRP